MRYPMETFILPKSKDPPIDKYYSPYARRITHIFDPIDMLDPEESPAKDPFLKGKPMENELSRYLPLNG